MLHRENNLASAVALPLLHGQCSEDSKEERDAMLKITKVLDSCEDVLLKLEGKITEQWAALLDEECRGYLLKKKVVYLDCSRVEYIDEQGAKVLNGFDPENVMLVSTSAYVTELLKHDGGRS